MQSSEDPDRIDDRITGAALRLFANLGYDSVDNQMIADAAGVSRGAVSAAGGRREIYMQIIEGFYKAQVQSLDDAEKSFVPNEAGVRRFIEQLLEFYLDHLDEMAIWQHRYLKDAADIPGIEETYRVPVFQRVAEIAGPEITRRVDVQVIGNLVSWSLRGFLTEGITRIGSATPLRQDSPEGRKAFGAYIYYLTDLIFRDNHEGRDPGHDRQDRPGA